MYHPFVSHIITASLLPFLFYCNFLIDRSFFRTAPIAVPPLSRVGPPYSLADMGAPIKTSTIFPNEGILYFATTPVIKSDLMNVVELPLLTLYLSVRSSIDPVFI